MIRVRFAPSPTGNLHIGGVRTALFNYLFARHHQGQFFLRIEDTDQQRSNVAYTQHILESLEWLGLNHDENVKFQSQRNALYLEYFERLRKDRLVYPCFCSKSEGDLLDSPEPGTGCPGKCSQLSTDAIQELQDSGRNYAWRFKNTEEGGVEWQDGVKGMISFHSNVIGDFVIRRSDGTFTYNFCVVVDDIDMNITHVIRGDDHVSNTPKQILLYHALNADVPVFAHIPMILGPDKKRLSKRHGATGLLEYRNEGFLKEALLNYLALLGWAYDDKENLFSLQDLVEKFSLDKVSVSPAVFDREKLCWFNGFYLRGMDLSAIRKELKMMIGEDTSVLMSDPLLLLYIPRASTLLELSDAVLRFWKDPETYSEGDVLKAKEKFLAVQLLPVIGEKLNCEAFDDPARLDAAIRMIADTQGVKVLAVAQVLRLAICGCFMSPPIHECLSILGKERSLQRIRKLAEFLSD